MFATANSNFRERFCAALRSAFLYSQALVQPDLRAFLQHPPTAVGKHYFQQVSFPRHAPISNHLQKTKKPPRPFCLQLDVIWSLSQVRLTKNDTRVQRSGAPSLHSYMLKGSVT